MERTTHRRGMSRGHCLTVGLLMALMAGCAIVTGGTPDWVKTGGGKGKEKGVYGVGAVSGVRNAPLGWEAAEGRARANLQRQLETYVAVLMRDYAATTTAGTGDRSAEEQLIERGSKTFSSGWLVGVRPIDRYFDKETMTYHVLVMMDVRTAAEALAQSKELSGSVRAYVQRNAERMFDKLEQEEQKRTSKP